MNKEYYKVNAKCNNCKKEFLNLNIVKGMLLNAAECPNCGCTGYLGMMQDEFTL